MRYYKYEPLKPNCIRLVHVVKAEGYDLKDDQVSLELKEVPFEDAKYDAVSYTWGPATLEEREEWDAQVFTKVERCFPILCQGKIVLVTRSLRNVLRMLLQMQDPRGAAIVKETQGFQKNQFTWIDGVCINQDDLAEREKQVSMMGQLFSKAERVLAYVGEPDQYSRTALETVGVLATVFHKVKDIHYQMATPRYNDPDLYALAQAKALTLEEWWEWSIFVNREWFRRTWVLQEVVYTREDPLLICGALMIRHSDIMWSLNMLYLWEHWRTTIPSDLISMPGLSERRRKYEDIIAEFMSRVHPQHLIFRHTEDAQRAPSSILSSMVVPLTDCKDPRDRLYATLGLATEFENLDQSLLPIDYTMSVREVYCRATKYIIQKSGSLDMLAAVKVDKKQNLPSWCPDFTSQNRYPRSLIPNMSVKRSCWEASSAARYDDNAFRTISDQLPVRGRCVGRVVNETSFPKHIVEVWNAALALLLSTASDTQPVTEASVRSLMNVLIDKGGKQLRYDRSHLEHRALALASFFTGFVSSWTTKAVFSDTDKARILSARGKTARDYFEQKLNVDENLIERVKSLIAKIQTICNLAKGAVPLLPDTVFLERALKLRQPHLTPEDILGRSGDEQARKYIEEINPTDSKIRNRKQKTITWFATGPRGRKLFFTDQRTFGLGHETLLAGDEIWLLAGGKTPYVLRQCSAGSYEFHGETYLDGVMYGEQWPESEAELVDIILE